MNAVLAREAASVTIRDVMHDGALLGNQFGGESWTAWRALLCGFYGLPLDADESSHWGTLTQRAAPATPFSELWLPVGRRGGKTRVAALLAVFEGAFRDYRPMLSSGEVATVMVLAADRRQATVCFRYISGLLHDNVMLERMITREDKESIELSNRVRIEVHTASFRTVRGFTLACVICDEIAFWQSEGTANPDAEIIAALRPALATLNGKLIALSSPYAKRGELWANFRRSFGEDDADVLVAQAPSRTMNPTLRQSVVDKAMEKDASSARAEYLAQFRDDLQSYVPRDVVEACVIPGRGVLPYTSGLRYTAFTDPSGGSSDGFTLCIGHSEGQGNTRTVIIDRLEERKPPFSASDVVKDFAAILKEYHLTTVTGDAYAGVWPAERFAEHRIEYQRSKLVRTDLYKSLLPLLTSGRIELPDSSKLVQQLSNLERRTGRTGRDSIDHAPGQHDDVANAAAGLASLLSAQQASAYTLALMTPGTID